MGKLLISSKEKENIELLNNIITICEKYNTILYKYTLKPIGRISTPKKLDEIPSNFSSVKTYLNSQTAWKQIISLLEKKVDILDTIEVLISHWKDVTKFMGLPDTIPPKANIILSEKCQKMYQNYKELDQRTLEKNKKRGFKLENSSPLISDFSVDVSNLIKLKKLNPHFTYIEIVSIFKGEFVKEFISYIVEGTSGDKSVDYIIKQKLERIDSIE